MRCFPGTKVFKLLLSIEQRRFLTNKDTFHLCTKGNNHAEATSLKKYEWQMKLLLRIIIFVLGQPSSDIELFFGQTAHEKSVDVN